MRVLIGCEYSATIREAFRRKGHDAWSCDFLPTEIPGQHYQCDVMEVIGQQWDLFIVHPDCTFLSVSGIHWNTNPKSYRFGGLQTLEALDFVAKLFEKSKHIPRVCLENPISIISTKIMPPSQTIQPNQFGEDASKATCLWLKGLPKLTPTKQIPPRIVMKDGKQFKRWANQTDSGQNRLGPSEDRWKIRSKTYNGIADAMAEQWNF